MCFTIVTLFFKRNKIDSVNYIISNKMYPNIILISVKRVLFARNTARCIGNINTRTYVFFARKNVIIFT